MDDDDWDTAFSNWTEQTAESQNDAAEPAAGAVQDDWSDFLDDWHREFQPPALPAVSSAPGPKKRGRPKGSGTLLARSLEKASASMPASSSTTPARRPVELAQEARLASAARARELHEDPDDPVDLYLSRPGEHTAEGGREPGESAVQVANLLDKDSSFWGFLQGTGLAVHVDLAWAARKGMESRAEDRETSAEAKFLVPGLP